MARTTLQPGTNTLAYAVAVIVGSALAAIVVVLLLVVIGSAS